MKRLFDVIVALALMVPATVIVAVAAIAVRLESAGPPLFLQTRVGRHQRPFRLIKLRTMHHGTAEGASHEIGASTITRIGAFLRRTKIDELPQVWSVLVGDMSFVGPRPCLPLQTELVDERARLGVFALRPGITGKAQVMGVDMSQPRLLARLDAEYAANQSLKGDLLLIAQTVSGRGYYDAAARRN